MIHHYYKECTSGGCLPPRALRMSNTDSAKRLRAIHARDGFLCRWCKIKYACTVEHVVPKSRGGSNDIRNLVGACSGCNNKRGDSYDPLSRAEIRAFKKFFKSRSKELRKVRRLGRANAKEIRDRMHSDQFSVLGFALIFDVSERTVIACMRYKTYLPKSRER